MENASGYVVKASTPTAPKITLNLMNATTADVTSAISVYDSAASAYTSAISDIVANREYIVNRLMYDVCATVGPEGNELAKINYATNKVQVHVKADDVFAEAMGNKSLTNAQVVSAVAENVSAIYNKFYVEGNDNVLVSSYVEEDYDAKAYTVASNIDGTLIESGAKFINALPNQTGTACTYDCYEGGSAVYHLEYRNTSSDVANPGWFITDIAESADVAYCSATDLADAEWIAVNAETNESEQEP